ncbi:MAG: penicillin-binding protein 2, partial [Pseudomonadota bacterium]
MRVGIAGVFVLAAFSLLLLRFAYLQLLQYDYYRTKAEDNRISVVPIVPNRGLILDRSGAVLARNYSAYTLEISPGKVANLEKTVDELAAIIEIRPSDRTRL